MFFTEQFSGYFVGTDVILFKCDLIFCELLREDNAPNSSTFNSWKVSTFFSFLWWAEKRTETVNHYF